MKMLGQPNTPEYQKYSELSAAIFNELSDAGATMGRWSSEVKLVSSSGRVIGDDDFRKTNGTYAGVTKALQIFIAALNWLAYKSVYYSLAAKHLSADSFIHPIRHAYQIHWMKKTGAFGHDFTSRLIQNLAGKARDSISDVVGHGRTQTIGLEVPIFSAWLTQESGSLDRALKAALELKNTDQFVVARETMKGIKIAYEEHGLASGNRQATKLLKDLDAIAGDLRRSFGVPSSNGIQGSFFIKAINFVMGIAGVPALPDKEFAISTPEFIKSRRTKAFSAVFKNIANELTSIERLGGLRDKMLASFKIDDQYYVSPKTEDPRFRRFSSDWKMPM
jgi:hypothetical protein